MTVSYCQYSSNYIMSECKNLLRDRVGRPHALPNPLHKNQPRRSEASLRSLRTCHRPSSRKERKRYNKPRSSNAYIPELSENLDKDLNLNNGARRCARILAGQTYRKNRVGRFIETTVPYLMKVLNVSRSTVQRYLRALEREGYIDTHVINSARAQMCVGLRIALLEPLFAAHHKKKWPDKAVKSGASKMRHNNRFNINYTRKDLISVQEWTFQCMEGVWRAFKKSDEYLLILKNNPLYEQN